ncbi:adenosylcobinamide-phosphate synthase CbiB [Butyrivibrio sp. YAB3001]|uniref:adenosylcobinamide-phosphate synthase CbiB n=1 Tax=Butyrivibrio sp. YAB3001 TaxID=1520812 RepID=UPI0008F67B0A|nr:adenosylcobinamide-phosphate synthase CbiB [Butyrivibrio sp. YAB3001]SFC55176.1 adenosylcobinamide-phosphate synthase [Butyrivibrio sp. YAB3001]
MVNNHIIAFAIGFCLDRIIGDPYNIPHPIRLIGNLISFLDKKLLGNIENKENIQEKRDLQKEKRRGILMATLVILITAIVTFIVSFGAYFINKYLGIVVEAVLTCYILAAKSLKDESMKVYKALETGTIEDARKAVSMIVGRDTASLDKEGVTKAVVETVAENTSDGVIAPLIYTFIGGPVLGLIYKAINTMDSMVGYHNDKYEYFGKAAAKIDDVANYLPARASAVFMIIAAFFGGKDYSASGAIKIFKRDRYNHKSPNSAQTESVCAGALSVRLAGDASYFGKIVKKPYIGDPIRAIETDDIKRACRLMYLTEYICGLTLLALWAIVKFVV